MGAELHTVWTCRECGVRAYRADGEAFRPKGWKDDLCKKCLRQTEPSPSNYGHDEDYDGGAPAKPKPKRPKFGGRKKAPPPPPLTAEQQERAAVLMREGMSNPDTANAIGGHYERVKDLRVALGIGHPANVRGELGRRAARAYLAEHPGATVEQIVAGAKASRGLVLATLAELRDERAAAVTA